MPNLSPTRTAPRCLLMSAGSLVGQNIQEILTREDLSCDIIALNSVASEPSLAAFKNIIITPNTHHSTYADFFKTLVAQYTPDIIIPCRDEDVIFLAHWAVSNPHWQSHCLVGSPTIANALKDKYLSYTLSQELNIPFVPSVRCESIDSLQRFAEAHGFPLLVKPASGFASQHVFVITQENQLESWQNQPDYLLQPWLGSESSVSAYASNLTRQGIPLFHSLEEEKYSIQLFFSASGKSVARFFTRHHMRQGQSLCVEKIEPCEELKHIAKTSALAFEGLWRGPLNMQLQGKPNGKYWIYEFNGRLTGASSARALMGFNELALIWKHFLHLPLQEKAGENWPNRVFKRWHHLAEYSAH